MSYSLLLLVNIFIYLHLQKRACVYVRVRVYIEKIWKKFGYKRKIKYLCGI